MKTDKPRSHVVLTRLTILIFIMLVLLTFLSRTIAVSMRPTVNTALPRAASLTESIDLIGIATYSAMQKIASTGAFKVEEVFVAQYIHVLEGTPLCKVDVSEYLLQNKRYGLSILQLQNQLDDYEGTKTMREELRLQLEILLEEQRLYNENYPSDGIITAPCAGILSQLFIETGQALYAGQSICEILPSHATAEVVFALAPDEAMHYQEKDSVTLMYSEEMDVNGLQRLMPVSRDATISQKRFDVDRQHYLYYASIESAQIFKGQEISVRLTQTTPMHDTVVPLSAVHEDAQGRLFVYVLKHRDGLWGNENYVQQLYIEAIAQNNLNMAIDNRLMGAHEEIVTSASEFLTNGQIVRVVEP